MTKHKADCQMSFGCKDPACPRCQELLAGAAPRQAPWFKRAADSQAARIREIKAHDCERSHCGPVCTFGDW